MKWMYNQLWHLGKSIIHVNTTLNRLRSNRLRSSVDQLCTKKCTHLIMASWIIDYPSSPPAHLWCMHNGTQQTNDSSSAMMLLHTTNLYKTIFTMLAAVKFVTCHHGFPLLSSHSGDNHSLLYPFIFYSLKSPHIDSSKHIYTQQICVNE